MAWGIGRIKITPIVEKEGGDIIQSIIPNATKESILKVDWLLPHFADKRGMLKAVVQAFVIETPNTVILIDSCVGNDKKRESLKVLHTNFLKKLTDHGYPTDSIRMVLCTHLHFDHVGWNTFLSRGRWMPTFPSAKYLFTRQEFNYWKGRPEKEIADDHAGFTDSVLPVYDAGLAKLIDNEDKIAEGVSLIPTLGHTPGHVSVLIESKRSKAVITGDVIHHPCQIAYPDWGTTSDTDRERARISRYKFLDRFANTETLFIGSHFSPPTAGRVEENNDDFRFIVDQR